MMHEKTHVVTEVVQTNAGVSVTVRNIADGGERVLLLKRKAVKECGLESGLEIEAELLGRLEAEAELSRAEARMVRILSYSDHSVNLLVRKLVSHGFSQEIAQRAAQSAVDQGYIKEDEQAKNCAEYFLKHKYWGKKRIAMELVARGYNRQSITDAIDELGDAPFHATLVRIIEKKYPERPKTRETTEKLTTSLCRMGYSVSEINAAMREVYGS